jgi:hypothetical protein
LNQPSLGRRALAQAVSQGDLHLARHENGGLEGGFGGQTLRDKPDTRGKNPKDNQNGSKKHRHLLLAQAH